MITCFTVLRYDMDDNVIVIMNLGDSHNSWMYGVDKNFNANLPPSSQR